MAKTVKKMANSAISELPYIKVDREFCNSVAQPYQTTMLPPPPPTPASQKEKTVPQKSMIEVILSKKKKANAQKHINK